MDWLRMSAAHYPDRPALIFGVEVLTYHELDSAVSQVASDLLEQFPQGLLDKRIGIYLPSSVDFVLVIHAVIRLGGVIVPLNTRLSERELTGQMSRCDVVLAPSTWVRKGANRVLYNDYANYNIHLELSRPFAWIFTSGTTGQPKAAELSHSAIYHSAIASALRIGHHPNDRWLCTLPLYHIGGLSIIMRAALYGICVVLQDGFKLDAVNHALDHQKVTLASLVPTMLYRLIQARQNPPPHLRLVLLGGAAATPELVSAAQATGFPLATTYGLTEAASQVCTQLPEQTRQKPGSVGKPLPFAQIRVIDGHGNDCPPGEVGEIIVHSPTLMTGYADNSQATAATIRDGWLYTGDLGYLDADGDLWLVQRRSDLIVSGGENIYPAEVETALRAHPAVRDVVVVGLPHPEWGQQVAAAIILKPNISITAQTLVAELRTQLAGYKIPRIIRYVDSFPLTASSKVDRKAVAGLFNDYAN
jgi:O-succinylbenzoic acid--CoA ligase